MLIYFHSSEFQCQDNEHVEIIDHVEGIDQNSSRNPVKIIMQEIVNACLVCTILKAESFVL